MRAEGWGERKRNRGRLVHTSAVVEAGFDFFRAERSCAHRKAVMRVCADTVLETFGASVESSGLGRRRPLSRDRPWSVASLARVRITQQWRKLHD